LPDWATCFFLCIFAVVYKPTKVIVVDNSPDITGALKAITATTDDLRQLSGASTFEFVFVLPRGSKGVVWLRGRGYRVYELPFVEIRKQVWALLCYVPMLIVNSIRLRQIVRSEGGCLIHVNDFFNWAPVIVRVLLDRRVPLVTHIRMPVELRPAWLYKVWSGVAAHTADAIVAVSKANTLYLANNTRVRIIYDRVPDTEYLPRYEPCLHIPIRILYLANYIPNKGQRYAVQVAAHLKNMGSTKFEIHFWGSDMGLAKNIHYKQYLCTEIGQANLQDVCKVGAAVNDVEAIMKNYDMVLNFSDGESFSRVNLEAMFFGVPLITTSVGGTTEMIIPDQTAILVPIANVAAMTDAVQKLMQSFPLRQALSSASYTHVRTVFGSENTSARIQAIYEKYLHKK
jgi:glycosyltransferase involved in cell wall biosynthesis